MHGDSVSPSEWAQPPVFIVLLVTIFFTLTADLFSDSVPFAKPPLRTLILTSGSVMHSVRWLAFTLITSNKLGDSHRLDLMLWSAKNEVNFGTLPPGGAEGGAHMLTSGSKRLTNERQKPGPTILCIVLPVFIANFSLS